MRHLRTHAATVAIIAGLGLVGVACADDDDPTVEQTTVPADDATDMDDDATDMDDDATDMDDEMSEHGTEMDDEGTEEATS
ncbi:MAG: hypothetical protein R3249_05955 [Nitriliruptorales bacterium]|nr:hypothetical protein [Nitriliruptorales bacterium]